MRSVTLDLPDELARSLDRAAEEALMPPGRMAAEILSQAFDQRDQIARLAELARTADPDRVRGILDRVPDVPAETNDALPTDPADQPILPDSVRRVEMAAMSRGLPIRLVRTATTARSAEEAALAVGARVGQIVKSLVFQGVDSGKPYMLLVSGANRVDEALIARHLGEAVRRPDAKFVREATGFAIGGVSPLGATSPVRTIIDPDLLGHDVVWAAAGTPFHVFEVDPRRLAEALDAEIVPLAG